MNCPSASVSIAYCFLTKSVNTISLPESNHHARLAAQNTPAAIPQFHVTKSQPAKIGTRSSATFPFLAGEASIKGMEFLEPFVDAIKAGEFLSLRPRRILELARAKQLPAHPVGEGKRKQWRFRLSELANALGTPPTTIATSSPLATIRRK
jgi:hypothetical protein